MSGWRITIDRFDYGVHVPFGIELFYLARRESWQRISILLLTFLELKTLIRSEHIDGTRILVLNMMTVFVDLVTKQFNPANPPKIVFGQHFLEHITSFITDAGRRGYTYINTADLGD